ncbi:MAG: type II toxin-antitoxin system VapB family antitoxin [Chlamydiae bacterium]|nr:type II toxin-antitoxin system VapB family antitoxin [Chlamydiota bacterium]MBI3265507.1 type II toxin-antitoxin system VapB family antitoxin [Chlamydiota bacterium]
MMKITTYIDGDLLKRALKETGSHSQREVIETGLRNLLADFKRKRFVKDFNNLRLNLSLETLKKERS